MTSPRVLAASVVALAGLLVFFIVRQEALISKLDARAAPAPAASPPARASARTLSTQTATGTAIKTDPRAARRMAETLGAKGLGLDDAGVERFARFLRVLVARWARDAIRAQGKSAALAFDAAALAELDLHAELDRVGLDARQRRVVVESLPELRAR